MNLGNPQEMTILEFAERIRRLTGTTAQLDFKPLPQDDPKRRQPDIAKAKKILGWEPKVSLEDGLKETIAYFQSLPSPVLGAVRTGATSIQTFAAAALPSCTGFPAMRKRQRVVVIGRHHSAPRRPDGCPARADIPAAAGRARTR